MRHLSLALTAAVCVSAFTQVAAASDLPVKTKAAPIVTAPTSNWTGWYVGLNAGGGWGNDPIDNSSVGTFCNPALGGCLPGLAVFHTTAAAAVPGQFGTKASGFIGGVQIGYNQQIGAFVWGVETDFQGADIKGSDSLSGTVVPVGFPNPVTVTGTGSQKLDWLGTLRGRLGWTPINPLLLYVTGGLAYGHVSANVSFTEAIPSIVGLPSTPAFASASSVRTGWALGGGLEWMFAPRWSVKAEYLYYDLGHLTLNSQLNQFNPAFMLFTTVSTQSEVHFNGNIARVGVNYKF